ncbi:sugar phosphate isomerase/epimerase family protein [Millisia brevis]|uniref:sugar phosphate isomerase/epimerase family protein n=1 Tax=Millisia brevis TaxID=264148 RepID=UPI001FE099C2|nr:sugar phosphate isomerase/epimerase [Millisia brevis]
MNANPITPIALSTASAYPQNTDAAFRYAAELGYDGVELMIWADPVSQDIDAIGRLSRRYRMPVMSIHAPCLLVTQRVWGSDPAAKLDRSVQAAEKLGAEVVVVHPPFRWQRVYADRIGEQIERLEDSTGVAVGVENMFPVQAGRLIAGRLRRRGRSADRPLPDHRFRENPGLGPESSANSRRASAYRPSFDPTDTGHRHYTLDFSHTSAAGVDALALARRMGAGLVHFHLADGDGHPLDQHMVPGAGTQPIQQVCRAAVEAGFAGSAAVEVTTKSARTVRERTEILERALVASRGYFARGSTDPDPATPGGPDPHTHYGRPLR